MWFELNQQVADEEFDTDNINSQECWHADCQQDLIQGASQDCILAKDMCWMNAWMSGWMDGWKDERMAV